MIHRRTLLSQIIAGIEKKLIPGVNIKQSSEGNVIASIMVRNCAFDALNKEIERHSTSVILEDSIFTIKGPDFMYTFHKKYLFIFKQRVQSL